MKNADNPAMPVSLAIDTGGDLWSSADMVAGAGLTKREYFAGLAMQGLLSGTGNYPIISSTIMAISTMSVQTADALLEELDK